MSRVLAKRALIAHPDHPAPAIAIEVELALLTDGRLSIDYVVYGAIDTISLPPAGDAVRTDGLWQTTCFEAFFLLGGETYAEFNFAPSGSWAAYRFTSYREGMAEAEGLTAPDIVVACGGDTYAQAVSLDVSALQPEWRRIGLSAVVEDVEGRKSYWALAHPPGKPDFHDPACFALEVPAPPAS